MRPKILTRLRALCPFPLLAYAGPFAIPHLPLASQNALIMLGDCGSNVRQRGLRQEDELDAFGNVKSHRTVYVYRGWRGVTTISHSRLAALTKLELVEKGRLTPLGRVTLRRLQDGAA